MNQIKEDGAVMSAGTGGFSGSAAAKGPVSGFDPVMKFKKNIKNQIKRAKPPKQPGVMVSDNW